MQRSTVQKQRKGGPSFFTNLKEELGKVSWTSKSELILCTKIVLGAIFALGFGVYLLDLMIKGALDIIRWVV